MVEMPFGTRLGKRKRLRSGRDEMLIPRFSIRLMLVLTTVFAVFFMVMSFAGRGSNAAAAVVSGVLTIGIAFAVYALLFSAGLRTCTPGAAYPSIGATEFSLCRG